MIDWRKGAGAMAGMPDAAVAAAGTSAEVSDVTSTAQENAIVYWEPNHPAGHQNFGDYLSEVIASGLLEGALPPTATLRVIGSVISPYHIRHDLAASQHDAAHRVIFWGCGLRDELPLDADLRRSCRFHGVRGPLSRDLLRLPANTVLGDTGLLLPLLHRPRRSPRTADKTLCMPHFLDAKSVEDQLRISRADVVTLAAIEPSLDALRDVLDDIASAAFVLSGSLHGAIAAHAYGVPFAFWDNGHLDVPFKWRDFAGSIGIPTLFVRNVEQGERAYESLIAPEMQRLPLAPILGAAPFAIKPSVLRVARELDKSTGGARHQIGGDTNSAEAYTANVPSGADAIGTPIPLTAARFATRQVSRDMQLSNASGDMGGIQAARIQNVISHLTGRLDEAPTVFKPWKYVYFENVFPADFYADLESGYEEIETLLVEQIHRGDRDIFHGSYRERHEFKAPFFGPERASVPAVYRDLQDVLNSSGFFDALKQKFGEELLERYGDEFDSSYRTRMEPTLLVTRHDENYFLGAHTDRAEKVFTCIFNVAEHSGLDHLGTAIYAPAQKDFISNGRVHHDPAKFARSALAPFRPNSALIFARTEKTFHGVERLSAAGLGTSKRRNIQFNIWDWNRPQLDTAAPSEPIESVEEPTVAEAPKRSLLSWATSKLRPL